MDINVKVRLESPELMAAILALAEALPKEKEVDKEEVKEKQDEAKAITLEEVRKALAAKSKNGKQAEVKELIKKYGVNKLTDIHPYNYKELIELAEEI